MIGIERVKKESLGFSKLRNLAKIHDVRMAAHVPTTARSWVMSLVFYIQMISLRSGTLLCRLRDAAQLYFQELWPK